MKTFDIDCIDPGYSLEPLAKFTKRKPTHREKVSLLRSTYVHVNNTGAWSKRLGIRPQTMLDWRGLERRMHEIHVMWIRANQEFWDRARSFRRSPGEGGSAVVAISDPRTDDDSVLKISGDGYSHDTQHRLLGSLLSNPSREGEFVMHTYDSGGRELGHLLRREIRLHRSYGTYRQAFERAVTDRLKTFAESRKSDSGRCYYYTATFIVVCCNRNYIFSMDNRGLFSLLEGDIFHAEDQ